MKLWVVWIVLILSSLGVVWMAYVDIIKVDDMPDEIHQLIGDEARKLTAGGAWKQTELLGHDYDYRMTYIVGFQQGQEDFWANLTEWSNSFDAVFKHMETCELFGNRQDLIDIGRKLQEHMRQMSTQTNGSISPVRIGSDMMVVK